MSDEPDIAGKRPAASTANRDEHPLSVLLFSWTRSKAFGRVFLAVLGGFCVVLAALEFVIHRHDGAVLDALPVFHGVFGFLSFGLAVVSGWPLGRLLRRPENFYGDGDSDGGEGGDDR